MATNDFHEWSISSSFKSITPSIFSLDDFSLKKEMNQDVVTTLRNIRDGYFILVFDLLSLPVSYNHGIWKEIARLLSADLVNVILRSSCFTLSPGIHRSREPLSVNYRIYSLSDFANLESSDDGYPVSMIYLFNRSVYKTVVNHREILNKLPGEQQELKILGFITRKESGGTTSFLDETNSSNLSKVEQSLLFLKSLPEKVKGR
ncbi:MAG: hypothetical protein ACFFD4_36280 [Candidatus Odinarchaeota archaeon]